MLRDRNATFQGAFQKAMSENCSSHLKTRLDKPFGGMKLDKSKALLKNDIYVINGL
jgi:hypothetical protein